MKHRVLNLDDSYDSVCARLAADAAKPQADRQVPSSELVTLFACINTRVPAKYASTCNDLRAFGFGEVLSVRIGFREDTDNWLLFYAGWGSETRCCWGPRSFGCLWTFCGLPCVLFGACTPDGCRQPYLCDESCYNHCTNRHNGGIMVERVNSFSPVWTPIKISVTPREADEAFKFCYEHLGDSFDGAQTYRACCYNTCSCCCCCCDTACCSSPDKAFYCASFVMSALQAPGAQLLLRNVGFDFDPYIALRRPSLVTPTSLVEALLAGSHTSRGVQISPI